MQLTVHKREKKDTKKLRHLNNVPAVVYAKGKENCRTGSRKMGYQ